jgi:hypothetical protein
MTIRNKIQIAKVKTLKTIVKGLSPGASPGVVKQLTQTLFAGSFTPQQLDSLVSYVFHLYSRGGARFVINYLKLMEKQLVNHLLANDPNADFALVRQGNYLRWVKRRLKSHFDLEKVEVQRLIMTLIGLKQLFITVCSTELASIDTKVEISKEISNGLASDIRKIGLPKFVKHKSPQLPKYYLSSKAGPNGNAFASRLVDSYALQLNPAELNSLKAFAHGLYGMTSLVFEDRFLPLEGLEHRFQKKPEIGRLLYIQEYGKLKCRVAAIVDGITQEILKPVHDLLMNILRKIPEDCTFDHDKIASVAKRMHENNQTFYGFSDLSDASDRIPRFLYQDALNEVLPNLGSLWCKLWERRFYIDNELSSHMTRKVKYLRYAVGQPMGALSSWPAMALVHHFLVWIAAGSYAKAKGKYCLLGDDIVIFEETLYLSYLSLLKSMHIPYKPNSSTHYFEFAKRHFVNGHEITGAYINAMCEELKTPNTAVLVWCNMCNRGYQNCYQVPEELFDLMKIKPKARAPLRILPLTIFRGENQGKYSKELLLGILGLSKCNYDYPEAEAEAIKQLHQATSIVLSNSISKIYRQAAQNTAAIRSNVSQYVKRKQPGLYNDFQTEVNSNIDDIVREHSSLTKSMEAQWKLLYLTKEPNIPKLLRPTVPEWVYPFTLGKRNKVKQVLSWRSSHLIRTIRLLQGHI